MQLGKGCIVDRSSALETSDRLLEDVKSLLANHPASKQVGPGRPAVGVGVDPLLRSCIALCYAAWEVYVEEALYGAVDCLLDNLEAKELPSVLRKWIAIEFGKSDPWKFAGNGWKNETRNLVSLRLYGQDGQNGFNSANSRAVKSLYSNVLGYDPLAEIKWQRMSNEKVLKEIEALVHERGAIVHTGMSAGDEKAKGKLSLRVVRARISFVERLREEFDDKLTSFITDLVDGR